MHSDEGKLEAAGKKAQHQHDIRAMRERLAERMAQRLLRGCFTPVCLWSRQPERQRQHKKRAGGKDDQGLLPADIIHQRNRDRRVEKLPERARGRTQSEGDRTPFRRQQLRERRENDHERGAGQAESDQDAGRKIEHRGAARVRHEREAGRVHQPTDAEHPTGAVAVGDHAGERLADAPQQVLQRERERRTRRGPSDWRPTSASEKSRATNAGQRTSARSGSRSR